VIGVGESERSLGPSLEERNQWEGDPGMAQVLRFLGGLKTLILTLLLLSCGAAMAQPNDVPIEHIIVF
jgi:hypothetical protein